MPNIISVPGSQLQVSVYGSVYYCSSGYDNKNPSPQMVVKPGAGIQKLFNDNLSMSVTPGQILVLSVVEPAADNGSLQHTMGAGSRQWEPEADNGSQKHTVGACSIQWESQAYHGSHKQTVGASSRPIRQHKRGLP